ncbi:MAG: MBL fold metallo-hydrolase [Dehalogenimonas sp.]|uniref:MBL fold metallo-hydrolase n=1 Tax=Candidatus Dehalogenimonas loeffleri TaxID=3127115 RepID=A0ABZ2J5J9_9CHLR|nr:MBL fold metallo-hydrolase [Dehalogenimonas sp.]
MQITIHRGTREIGGTCIELKSRSGKSRIVLDIGMPLVNRDMSPFEWDKYRELTLSDLISKRILPAVPGLYDENEPAPDGILISHSHLDHYGFLRFVNPQIPLFMSRGTQALAEVSNAFLDTQVSTDNIKPLKIWDPIGLGEFTITPYLMDHSAPDAVAFLISADGHRLFYTGDFRGHGRKMILLDRLLERPPRKVDVLLMEGSMLGREEGPYPDEVAVEEALSDLFSTHRGLAYIFASSQNLDRLVSIFRAARKNGRTIVIDLYTAFVLDKLRTISSSIPQFDWDGVRVLFTHYHAQKLADEDKQLLYKYARSKIEFEEIQAEPDNKVFLVKDNRIFRIAATKLKTHTKAIAIYSMWHGYLDKTNLKDFLAANEVSFTEVHTSGHAYLRDLERVVDALKPGCVIPVHTFHPEKYTQLFSNAVRLEDGENMDLDTIIKTTEPRCRALSTGFLEKFSLPDGIFRPLIELVQNNKDLHLELRGQLADPHQPEIAPVDEAVGIYFKGNSILCLRSNHKVEIHEAFSKGLVVPKYLNRPDDVQAYLAIVPDLMYRVSSRGKSSMEIEYEQMIIRANNFEERNNSEYVILANQYGVGSDRWDLVALKWPRLRRGGNKPVGQLALIEVKYALNDDIKDAHKQLARYYDYIKGNLNSLCDELELILRQKIALGLIQRTTEQLAQLQKLTLVRDISKIEMVLYLVDYNPNSVWKDKMVRKAMELPFRDQIRIRLGGLALWEQSLTPLHEAGKALGEYPEV